MKLQQFSKSGTYFLDIPLAIVRGMDWKKGDDIAVSIQGKDRLLLIKK